jgi:hypothetical protein
VSLRAPCGRFTFSKCQPAELFLATAGPTIDCEDFWPSSPHSESVSWPLRHNSPQRPPFCVINFKRSKTLTLPMRSSWYGSDDVVSNCISQAYGESLTADMMLTHVNTLALLYTRITISKMSGRLGEKDGLSESKQWRHGGCAGVPAKIAVEIDNSLLFSLQWHDEQLRRDTPCYNYHGTS